MARGGDNGHEIDISRIVDSIRKRLSVQNEGKITSAEIAPRVDFDTAFLVSANVRGSKKVEIRSDMTYGTFSITQTEAALYSREDENHIYFERKTEINPISMMGEAIQAMQTIKDRMNSGASFEEALKGFY